MSLLVTVIAGVGDWGPSAIWAVVGALLSVVMAFALDVSGAQGKMRERRRRQREKKARQKKEREARESAGGPTIGELGRSLGPSEPGRRAIKRTAPWTPDKEDRAPEGARLAAAFRTLRDGLRMLLLGVTELLDLVVLVQWVALFYLLLLAGVIWLEPLMEKLGFSAEAATGAVVADLVLMILTGAWLLTGIRADPGSIPIRLAETFMLVAVLVGAALLVVATGTVTYGALCIFFGGIAFLKAFK